MIVKRHAGLLQSFMRRHAQSRRPFLLIAFLVGEDEEDVGSGAHWATGPSRLGARSLRTRGLEGSGPKCRCHHPPSEGRIDVELKPSDVALHAVGGIEFV